MNFWIFYLIFIQCETGMVCGFRAAVRLDAPEDLLIAGVGGFRVQKRVVLMVEVYAGAHIQKYILTVGQSLDAQIQQRVHQVAGVDAGPDITDAPAAFKDGVVHRYNHAAGTGGLHNPQVGQLPLG